MLLVVTSGGCSNDNQNNVNTSSSQPLKSSNNDVMQKNVVEQLQLLKAKDKFPEEDWDQRGLIASPENVRERMNQEVNKFIDFVESRLKDKSSSMKEDIKGYMDDWDGADFDTEENEYVVDTMCQVMRMVEVDCNDVLN